MFRAKAQRRKDAKKVKKVKNSQSENKIFGSIMGYVFSFARFAALREENVLAPVCISSRNSGA